MSCCSVIKFFVNSFFLPNVIITCQAIHRKQQECISVGCVPSTAVAVSGGCLPRGKGVCPGGCMPRGCLPGGCLPGGCLPRGVSAQGGVCLGGVYTPCPHGLTDTYENITFPKLLLQTVIKYIIHSIDILMSPSHYC